MPKTKTNPQILNCEISYTKCFARAVETADFIRFRDDLLTDMYDHNSTWLINSSSDNNLLQNIETEITLRKTEEANFCKIVSFVPISNYVLQNLTVKPQITTTGFYVLDANKLPNLNNKKPCSIIKASNRQMLADILPLELADCAENDEYIGFCTRKSKRRGAVYLAAEGVNLYIGYDNGEAVGNCELFIDNQGIAKIEDFSVASAKQRQGYGSAILKYIIDTALNSGASTIYLVTNEDDTAKEMYLKFGFTKIGEATELFFKL